MVLDKYRSSGRVHSLLNVATLPRVCLDLNKYRTMNIIPMETKGVVTPERKSLDADLRLIAKNIFCLIDLLLYDPVNSYGHVGTLEVDRGVKQKSNKREIIFTMKCKSASRDFRLCVTRP